MINTTKYYDMAALSEAAYVDFSDINFSDLIDDKEDVKKALQNDSLGGKFSATQAQNFVNKWEIVSHQANTETGFSATLFRDRATGEYYYSARGTEPFAQGGVDLLNADLGDIVRDGLAINQIVDMYNDIQRITAGENTIYQAARLKILNYESGRLDEERETLGGVIGPYQQELMARDDIIIDSGTVYTIEMVNSDVLYSYSDVRAYGLGILLDPNAANVAGHSLGGHLAAAFTRLFPGSEATTINGAGFMTGDIEGLSGSAGLNIRNLFGMLGGADQFDGSKIHNIYGQKGIELTTMDSELGLMQQGGNEGIYIETTLGDSIGEIFDNLFGHGGMQMTDSLAVYDLFIRMDPRFRTTDATVAATNGEELLDIFLSMETGRQVSHTFENMVDALGGIFVNSYSPIDHTTSDDTKREKLYSAISQIQQKIQDDNLNSLTVTSLVTSIETIKSQALQDNETGLATRYALTRLNPFSITGDSSLYDKFNNKDGIYTGALDLHSESNPEGDLSEKYIEDRSKFLYYLAHSDKTLSNTEHDINFSDKRLTIEKEVRGGVLGEDYKNREYWWGTDGSDNFSTGEGSEGDDHLYGMGGNDTLSGFGGADHIEGGGDDDTLIGGAGNDTLFGGNGSDTLDGGTENDTIYGGSKEKIEDNAVDRLEGGAGNDTYYAGTGDVIKDSDGLGTVWFEGRELSTLTWTQTTEGSVFYEAGDFKGVLNPDSNTLRVSHPQTGHFITIENFSHGGLGISMDDYTLPGGYDYVELGSHLD